MSEWQSVNRIWGLHFARIRRARRLDADIDGKRLRGSGSGDGCCVWGERIVVGQDSEDSGARRAQKFDASEDAGGDDAWGSGGAGGDAGRDSRQWDGDGGSRGWEAVSAEDDEPAYGRESEYCLPDREYIPAGRAGEVELLFARP